MSEGVQAEATKTVRIGCYSVGLMVFELRAGWFRGGRFDMSPPTARMEVGLDGEWPEVVSALLHEALEACCAVKGQRWSPWPDASLESSHCLFVLSHQEFAQAIAAVAGFAVKALPELAKAHAKHHKKGR